MAFLPLAVALVALVLAFGLLARAWPDHLPTLGALVLPVVAAVLTVAGTEGPPTPAQHLAALRADPYALWDARGTVVADLVAWPLARLLGDAAAVLVVSALARAFALVLVSALTRAAGLGGGGAVLAQTVLLLTPAAGAEAAAGQAAALVARALLLLAVVHLARRIDHLDGARDAGAAFLALSLAQAAGREALRDGAVFVLVLACFALARGEGRRALRLLAAEAFALVAAGVLLEGGALAALWHGAVQPASETTASALVASYGLLPFLLLVPGWRALGPAGSSGRVVLRAALVAGALRAATGAPPPALLDGPLIVFAAAGLLALWRDAQADASAVQAAT